MHKKSLKIFSLIVIAFFLIIAVKQSTAISSVDIDQEIDVLNLQIQNQKKQISDLKSKQDELNKQITEKKDDQINLKNQLSLIDNRLAKAELDIDSANLEIDKTNLEIKKIEIDSNRIDQNIEKQKTHIADLLRLVYKQDQVTTLEALLLNNSLAEFLNEVKYLEDANEEISKSVDKLKDQKEQLEQNKITLNEKKVELEDLRIKLEDKKDSLAYEQQNKNFILTETRSSEKEYQKLLAQARAEEAAAEAEIVSAERLIRQKMTEKDRDFLNNGNSSIAWPVPKNYITSTFHDPDYPYRYIIGEHSAIDVRAGHGTTLRSAADGYVAKVKFNANSSDYGYIMIIHGNGLATVYGHISAVNVSADQYVSQGQVIGKTGGTPGTAGSGRFSTGAHLHFEVRKDGLPVDPLKYLP